MTVEELANKRYGGEFVFMLGHLAVSYTHLTLPTT